jgi:NAD(P)-dependent dehydrogenase (short-subunit alcohol dehydrogenase family)
MTDKTVIITGASRGIGAETAHIVARAGAQVVLFARSADALERQAEMIADAGGTAVAVVGDTSNAEDCSRLVRTTIEAFGSIDSLVNNAGVIQPMSLITNVDIQGWMESWEINFFGPLMLSQLAIPYIKHRRGRIVNVSSGAAKRAVLGWGAYSTAKAALDHLTLILAAEEKDITCVGVRPGVVDTAMQEMIVGQGGEGMPIEEHAKFVKQKAEGRLLPVEKPAQAIAALAITAPQEWSGKTLNWNDDTVQELVMELMGRIGD